MRKLNWKPAPRLVPAVLPLLAATACSDKADEARGVDHGETLLSVSASGHSEARPDKAQFAAGIQTTAASAKAASEANAKKIDEIVGALKEMGVDEKDIQTRSLSVNRIDWGDRKGQFAASNTVNVILRDVDKAGAAVAAVTQAGANLMSGPDLTMSDPEATANLAYAEAYKAARKRAEVYANAAGMQISRVLYIRDSGGQQGNRYFSGAVPMAPPPPPPPVSAYPVAMPESSDQSGGARIMPGQTASDVTIQVDFALRPK
ncbi:SIMPL domain-containing protein [Novosphingobium aquimarinum]|uniref:SIMPL domain-containing protein n=1 Tax=Novosphingobium aquimarinum TaxID=2682494 RepID=UPI001E514616|nr:SIMPL domain-containing protein [Novosphingobium aquimarinum]